MIQILVRRVSLTPAEGGMMFGNGGAVVEDDDKFALSNASPGKYCVNAYRGDLSQGVGGNLEIVLSLNVGQLDGTVQTEDQKPARGTTVTLIPDPPQPEQNYLYHQSMVDQNGHFNIKGIAPGKYRVFAWEDLEMGVQYDPEFVKRHESQGVRVTVAENGHEQAALTAISAAAVEEAKRR